MVLIFIDMLVKVLSIILNIIDAFLSLKWIYKCMLLLVLGHGKMHICCNPIKLILISFLEKKKTKKQRSTLRRLRPVPYKSNGDSM